MQLCQLRPIKLSLQSTDNSVNDLTFTQPVTVSRCTMRRFRFGWVSSHVTVFPQAAGLAAAEPEPAQAYRHGSGFDFTKPKPGKAEPKPRFSGQAELAHH